MGRGQKNFEKYDRQSLDGLEEMVGGNTNVEDADDDGLDGDEEHRKGSSYHP